VSRRDFPPARFSFRTVVLIIALFVSPVEIANAAVPSNHGAATGVHVTIVFGQEMGNIRPFSVTIAANGTIRPNGPIHIAGDAATISRDAIAGLVVLAQAEGFRSLPSFTSCPGALPDLATRYISITTLGWKHRASARGGCLDSLNQLFAVLMDATHASY
jgi:hypothetical protein